MNAAFTEYCRASKDRVDRQLSALVISDQQPTPGAGQGLDSAGQAMQYSLLNGGKRIRAILVYAAATASSPGKGGAGLDQLAGAVEMIHGYSLVHDDLPAMDDDDLRRGIPSCHRAFDEATAILAGDALQARAFELLASASDFSDAQRVTMIKRLATAAGPRGMVGGQFIDIQATDSDMSLEQLQAMHALKTGALIRAALALGGIAAGATEQQLAALDEYGTHVGLAFQVVDDILDVEGDTATLGKTGGKDGQANKPTYVKLLGLGGAKAEALRLLQSALQALEDFGDSADHLRELARYIIERDH